MLYMYMTIHPSIAPNTHVMTCLTFRGALREERCTEEGTEALQCPGQCGSTTTEEEASVLEKLIMRKKMDEKNGLNLVYRLILLHV